METIKLSHECVIEIDDEPFLISHQFTEGKWRTSCKRRTYNPYPFGNSLHINYGVRVEALEPFHKLLFATLHKWYRKLDYMR
jgi:hypothetical protein